MADTAKITELTEATAAADDDLLVIEADVGEYTQETKKIEVVNFINTAPALEALIKRWALLLG